MRFTLGAFAILLAAQANAQTASPPADPKSVEALVGASLPIEADRSGQYSGPGWNRLLDAAGPAQFFIIGEQHGSGAIGDMEVALQRDLFGRGYTHTALEIGAQALAATERMDRVQPGSVTEYLAKPGNGFAIPFLFVRQEMPLLTQGVALSPDMTHALWGLDQEFIGSAAFLASIISQAATTPTQRTAAGRYAAAAQADPFYLAKGSDDELAALAKAFEGKAKATEIITAIRASRAIYAAFTGSGGPVYPANLARETMMKRNFQHAFEDAEQRMGKPPRVFLKFGLSHAMHGHSLTDVPALGNFIGEWGTSRGFKTVNVLIDCSGGELLNPQTSEPMPCESAADDAPALRAAAQRGPTLQIIDLAALRPLLPTLTGIDPATRRLILAVDYYIPIKGGTASTPIGKFPRQ